MLENEITGKFISDALRELEDNGWLEKRDDNNLLTTYEFSGNSFDKRQISESTHQRRFFVRRLRHLQHICQTFEGNLSENANVIGKPNLSSIGMLRMSFSKAYPL